MDSADLPDLLDAMRRAADVLRSTDIPFALCGGLAVFARGGIPSDHDVDFLIREEDVERTLRALAEAGFRTERPPLNWLVKAYDGDVLIDLIFRPVDRPVTAATLADTDPISVFATILPVLSATELFIHTLTRLTTQECDFTGPLLQLRTIREQIDIDRVRDETKASPFARSFLVLAEELDLLPSATVSS